ncbi:MAG TPA: glycosyltransferase family 4 protein [Gaiellaceae bacterium]
MRKLIFLTQKLDPADPVLAATVPMVRALAARVDELVVLCDDAVPEAAPPNVRIHRFGAHTQLQRGARFERALARELSPRPGAIVAHMVPLFAVLAAPLVRPLGIPLLLWYTHWKGHVVVRAAEKLCTAIVTVDRRSFPLASSKVRAIGHGIDVSEFACTPAPDHPPLRALALGRYSPAKGLDHVVDGIGLARSCGLDVELDAYGAGWEEARRDVEQHARDRGLTDRVRFHGPVPRTRIPGLFAGSHVLVNNMKAGAPDKVVYEAAASCLPVLASNPVFDDLLPDELRFERDRPETLSDRLLALDPRRRPDLRERVVERHSVESWADGILAAAERR